MKLELTEEQSKELSSYSENPDNEYIYSLQDLISILPNEILVGDLIYRLVMTSLSNEQFVCGYCSEFSWWGGENITSQEYHLEYAEELIDALFKLIIWNLKLR